jgi:excisionase family DNA binding protein
MSTIPFQTWSRNELHRPAIKVFLAGTHASNVAEKQLTLAERIERIEGAMTADKLAELHGVSKITIFKQAKAGRIPSFRIGTCIRFDPRAVANWLRRV